MSAFLTELRIVNVDDANDKLTRSLVFESDVLKRKIKVPRGFVTDYASVPRLPVAYLLAGGEARKAAVVHDYLYRNQGLCTRAQADAVFEEAMRVTGQPWWRRKLMWLGVRTFGWGPYAGDAADARS